jgi:hypothetical protein
MRGQGPLPYLKIDARNLWLIVFYLSLNNTF